MITLMTLNYKKVYHLLLIINSSPSNKKYLMLIKDSKLWKINIKLTLKVFGMS